MVDQPTAEKALKELEPLVGEWTMEATPPGGPPWPGETRTTFGWLEGDQLLMGRSTVEMPEAPNTTFVIGCGAANGISTQVYSDDGTRIDGRWEAKTDGRWETDFDLVYTRVR